VWILLELQRFLLTNQMSMRMQVAEAGSYSLTLYKSDAGVWDFWIKQKGRLLVKAAGTSDCEETKMLMQRHLYDVVMTKKERKHFDPSKSLEWTNYLHRVGGPELAG
jgi:hypothetical protein